MLTAVVITYDLCRLWSELYVILSVISNCDI